MVSSSRDGARCQPQHSAQIANSVPFGHLQKLTLIGSPSIRIDLFVNLDTASPQPGQVVHLQDRVLQDNPHMIEPKDSNRINICAGILHIDRFREALLSLLLYVVQPLQA